MTVAVTLAGGHGDGISPTVTPGGSYVPRVMMLGVGLLPLLITLVLA